ncbi:hypothetical protein Q7P37_005666 [Cladosporium fusiforme]
MSETRSNPPPVPCVEDYNSDDSTTEPNTKVEARKHAPSSRKPSAYHHKLPARAAGSDSGYSSTVASSANSHPTTNNQPTAQAPLPTASRSSKPPMIHRTENQQSQSRPSRSASVSRQPAKCSSPTCQDPNCAGSRGVQPGYDMPYRPQPQQQHSYTAQYPVQNPMAASPYVQAPAYPQPQRPAAQPIPIYGAQSHARPRTSSTTRSRPVSWAAGGSYSEATGYQYGGIPQGSYGTQHHGPPPSPSAYRGSYTSQYPGASYMASYLGSGSPRESTSLQQSSRPPISARHSSIMPGSFPIDGVNYDSEPQPSSSESEDDEEYEERRRHDRNRRRDNERERAYRELEDRRAMPPPTLAPARRPSLKSARTTPLEGRHSREIMDGRHSREAPRRAPYSENDMSSSDYIDSDRTTRPVIDKRLTYSPPSSNRHSRQSSVSNGSSASRHKSSSLSHSTRPPPQQYIVEDEHGRKYHYPTREQAEGKALRLREEAAEAYQARRGGNSHPALSAENVKRSQTQTLERRPSSHVSGSSKKSAASSSKMSNRADSTIQIQRGETVFNIPINTTLEVRQTDEGETWFIGSSSPPREKSYHGGGSSKSSGSRMGRSSRTGSELGRGRRDTIHEEDGYERGL